MDLVAATVDALGLVEHAILGEYLVDGLATTRGVVFAEDVLKIAGEQGRYAVGRRLRPHVWLSLEDFACLIKVKARCPGVKFAGISVSQVADEV